MSISNNGENTAMSISTPTENADAMSISTSASSRSQGAKRPEIEGVDQGVVRSARPAVLSRKTSRASAPFPASSFAQPPSFARTNSAPELAYRNGVVYAQPSRYLQERRGRIQQPIRSVHEEEELEDDDELALRTLPQLMSQRMDPASRYRHNVRTSHPATDEWYTTYEQYEIGTIPPKELCDQAPDSQKALADIPIKKSSNKTSSLMHFFILVHLEGYDEAASNVKENFMRHQCAVLTPEGICSKQYSVKGQNGKTAHMLATHKDMWLALGEFRKYQEMVRGVVAVNPLGETAPLGTRYEVVRQEQITSNMRKPNPGEINDFYDRLLRLVVDGGASFNLLEKPCVAELCQFLNNNFPVPAKLTLQKRLLATTQNDKAFIKAFLTSRVDKVSLTLDGWSSRDRRKFLGITCHFFSTSSGMVSFILGMEHVYGRQTAVSIMKAVGKSWVSLWHFFELICPGLMAIIHFVARPSYP